MNVSISPVVSVGAPPPEGEHKGNQQEVPQGREAVFSGDRLTEIVEKANRSALVLNARVSFSIDQRTNKVIIRVIDGESNEVIRQIPPEEMLRVSAHMDELLGLLFDRIF